jgi:hypothetical protein
VPERLVPVLVDGPPLEAWLGQDIPESGPGPVYAQCWVDAPEGVDPRQAGLGPLMRVLARVTYRPRWRFVLTHRPAELGGYAAASEWLIHVHTWVEDAYHPGRWMEGHSFAYLPGLGWDEREGMDEEGWVSFLHRYVIPRIEEHETDEWFRYGGARIFDPHAPRSARGSGGGGQGYAAGGTGSGASGQGQGSASVSNGGNAAGGCGGGGRA